jgi:ornithine cyclodeaminase
MRYVGVEEVVALVAETGIDQVLLELATYIEEDFARWPEFEKSARYASHSDKGVIELMPTSDGAQFAFKYVNGHPSNALSGLQTVVAFGVLANVATGYPELISEMTILTALRTAATSALAARRLARPDASTMAMIGLGAQSEFQAHAFKALLGIKRLRVFDVDPDATSKFMANLGDGGFEIVPVASTEEAVIGADIITTVTADKRRATILSGNLVGAGVHLNAVGGDCPGKTELQREIVERANVFVEYAPQTRIEGEIQQMAADFPVTELWQVITGDKPGRRGSDEITLFDSVGFAIEDFAALRYVHDKLLAADHATSVDLIASPEDPRNLFGLLRDVPKRATLLQAA